MVSDTIRRAREAAGLTQQQLGEQCGYTGIKAQIYVARWEAGTRPVPKDKLKVISATLKIALEDLLE